MANENLRIIQLPPATTGVSKGKLPVYNSVSGRTEQAEPQALFGAQRASFNFNPLTTYATGDLVFFRELVWRSLQDGNLAHYPSENVYWTNEPISTADGLTLTPHATGVFTYNSSVVQYNGALYFLNVAAPYLSSDFLTELAAGDWIKEDIGIQTVVQFTPQVTPPAYAEASFYYRDALKSFVIRNDSLNSELEVGREMWERSINKTGTASTNGKVVYVSGAVDDDPEVSLAIANSEATSRVIAIYTEDVAIDGIGEATTTGRVRGLDTSPWVPGTILYLSETVAGGFTSTPPSVPNIRVQVAVVYKQHATDGVIRVAIGSPVVPQLSSVATSWSAFSGSTTATNWVRGFYTFNAAITPTGTPTNIGNANSAHGAHIYVVLGAASTDMVLRFTGTSFNDETGRTAADTEDIDTSGGVLNDYFETGKKWIGQVQMTLLSGTGVILTYGLSSYWDNANTSFVVEGFEWVGRAGANDASPNIRLFHHKLTGWTYGAGGATPPTPIANMQTDYVTEYQFINGRNFKYKKTGIDQAIQGDQSEGIVIGIDISANNAVSHSTVELIKLG